MQRFDSFTSHMDIHPLDQRFLVSHPDPGFSAKRNRAIIEETIRKNDLLREQKRKAHEDKIRERAEAVTDYLHSKAAQYNDTPIEQYLGKTWLAYFQGKRIVGKIKNALGKQTIVLEEIV